MTVWGQYRWIALLTIGVGLFFAVATPIVVLAANSQGLGRDFATVARIFFVQGMYGWLVALPAIGAMAMLCLDYRLRGTIAHRALLAGAGALLGIVLLSRIYYGIEGAGSEYQGMAILFGIALGPFAAGIAIGVVVIRENLVRSEPGPVVPAVAAPPPAASRTVRGRYARLALLSIPLGVVVGLVVGFFSEAPLLAELGFALLAAACVVASAWALLMLDRRLRRPLELRILLASLGAVAGVAAASGIGFAITGSVPFGGAGQGAVFVGVLAAAASAIAVGITDFRIEAAEPREGEMFTVSESATG